MSRSNGITRTVVAAFAVIAIPLLSGFLKKDSKPDLTGIVIAKERPKLTAESWFDGTYQELTDDYNSDHWAFKETMVRLNNQLYFDAFGIIRVNGFVLGKDNYVFSENYIFAAFGDDIVPAARISAQMRKARVVQDSLKAHGVSLVLGLAPGKGSYCSQFVPDKYRHPVSATNYSLYVREARAAGLNVLDLHAWFMQMKPAAPHPLFPQFGHHWSYYGECLTVDTMVHYVEKLTGRDLPEIAWDRVEISDTARSRDADVLKSMNLWSSPPQTMQLAYPDVKFEADTTKNRTRMLVIGDSYWYGPVYLGAPERCFGKGEFWYYYNKVIPPRQAGVKLEVWELDLKKELESNQVVMMLYSDGNLPAFANNFIDDAYLLYTDPAAYKRKEEANRVVQSYAKQIRDSPVLLKKATAASRAEGLALDSVIRREAGRMAGINLNERK